jgi:hypothetical protein
MTQKIVIFNEAGDAPISVVDYTEQFATNLAASTIKHKIVEINANQYYWGNYATGSVVDKHDMPLIDELAIDTLINKEILSNYPVHSQLNILAECLEQAGIPLTADFIEMRRFIKQKAENHNNAKQTYKDNPDIYAFWPKPTIDTGGSKY